MKKKLRTYYMAFGVIIVLIILLIIFFSNNKKQCFEEQWALCNNGQTVSGKKGKSDCDININKAWNLTKGDKDIIVGILDSGISPECNNIFINKKEIVDGIDNDNNGYIDDVNGWDFYNQDNSVYDSYIRDYHASYITNIIVGKDEYYGVAPNVTILPLKFMSGTEGDTADAVSAIEYAHDIGAKIINCSWDFQEYDEELYNTIRKYDDILFVCAAGKTNLNMDEEELYPAGYELDNIISVMAIDNQGKKYDYSGYGKCVDVAAPGVDILCLLPEGDQKICSGTSIATAYVSGIAALILSENNKLDIKQLTDIIKENANKISYISELVASGGIIDAYSCVKEAQALKSNAG